MRLFFIRLAVVGCIAAIATGQACACKCSSNFHGKTPWEEAKLEREAYNVIFEGTPVHLELQWNLLTAKEGEWIPTGNSGAQPGEEPVMLVTFRVQKAYKGVLGPEVQLKTGLGGGDCGAVYEPGLTYLVFASRPSRGYFEVSMCSPGAWSGASTVATELRYLRKERPIASDLALIRRPGDKEYAAQEAHRSRDLQDDRKRYAAATGKICGTVSAEKTKDLNTGLLSFLATTGYSPARHPTANVNPDGSFCSGQLGPGKYYLYFDRSSDGGLTSSGLTSATYYPGVSEQSRAATIEVSAGQTQSNISFKLPAQKTFSVRGTVSIDDKSGLEASRADVVLIAPDDGPFPFLYSEQINLQSRFPLPRLKYFDFEHVLPGRYFAYVFLEFGGGLYTKKTEVNVTTRSKFILLQLIHKK